MVIYTLSILDLRLCLRAPSIASCLPVLTTSAKSFLSFVFKEFRIYHSGGSTVKNSPAMQVMKF